MIFHLIYRFLVTCLARVHPSMSPVQLRYSKHIKAQAIKLALTKKMWRLLFRKDLRKLWEESSFFLKASLNSSIIHTTGSSDTWEPTSRKIMQVMSLKDELIHLCPSGQLLLAGGGGALRRGAVRHSPPGPVQTEREGHHQRFPHRPLPGQRDLLLGRRGIRQKMALRGKKNV